MASFHRFRQTTTRFNRSFARKSQHVATSNTYRLQRVSRWTCAVSVFLHSSTRPPPVSYATPANPNGPPRQREIRRRWHSQTSSDRARHTLPPLVPSFIKFVYSLSPNTKTSDFDLPLSFSPLPNLLFSPLSSSRRFKSPHFNSRSPIVIHFITDFIYNAGFPI